MLDSESLSGGGLLQETPNVQFWVKKELFETFKKVIKIARQEEDKSRSIGLVHNVRYQLTDWVEKTILQLSVRWQRELQMTLQNPQAAAQHAYVESFGKENWHDVIDYCKNSSEYLRRVFEKRFDRIANDIKQNVLAAVKHQVGTWVRTLKEVIMQWKNSQEHQRQPTDKITTKQFVEFAASRFHLCISNVGTVSSDQMFETLIPDNVEISDPRLFIKFFLENLDSPNTLEEALYDLAEQHMDKQLNQVKSDVWETAKGCPEICPFCNAKCSLEKDHLKFDRKHECDVHILPALSGFTLKTGGKNFPVFERCTSEEFLTTPKQKSTRPETRRPNITAFFRDFYPNWHVPDCVPPVENSIQNLQQKRAWVNCRAPLLRRYDYMTDTTPEDWIQRYENNPLR